MVPVLILAAGASSRMRGRDKLLEDIEGQSLLRRQACAALLVSGDVRIALPPRPHPRYDVVKDLPVRLIEVPDAASGMAASLRTGFATLTDHQRAMLLLADLPDITAQDMQTVMSASQHAPDAAVWRGATEDGKGGHPMLLDRTIFSTFQSLQGDAGGQAIVDAAQDRVHLVPLKGHRARLDLDTPEDWARWRAAQTTSGD